MVSSQMPLPSLSRAHLCRRCPGFSFVTLFARRTDTKVGNVVRICIDFGPGLDKQVQKKSTSRYESACRLCDLCDLYGHAERHSQPRSDLPGSRHASPLIPIVSLFAYPLPGFHPSASALLACSAAHFLGII